MPIVTPNVPPSQVLAGDQIHFLGLGKAAVVSVDLALEHPFGDRIGGGYKEIPDLEQRPHMPFRTWLGLPASGYSSYQTLTGYLDTIPPFSIDLRIHASAFPPRLEMPSPRHHEQICGNSCGRFSVVCTNGLSILQAVIEGERF